jgi:hypothetical protein
MAHFIWFDNDNLDYGGIGVVEYGNNVEKIRLRGRPHETAPENDNPLTAKAGGQEGHQMTAQPI